MPDLVCLCCNSSISNLLPDKLLFSQNNCNTSSDNLLLRYKLDKCKRKYPISIFRNAIDNSQKWHCKVQFSKLIYNVLATLQISNKSLMSSSRLLRKSSFVSRLDERFCKIEIPKGLSSFEKLYRKSILEIQAPPSTKTNIFHC